MSIGSRLDVQAHQLFDVAWRDLRFAEVATLTRGKQLMTCTSSALMNLHQANDATPPVSPA